MMLYAVGVSENRWAGARCIGHSDLPWTSDVTPSEKDISAMSAVCAECPVLMHCALYALREASGGFYAGIWMPWDKSNSVTLLSNRRRARHALRERVRRRLVNA
jgi:hypothetical protein